MPSLDQPNRPRIRIIHAPDQHQCEPLAPGGTLETGPVAVGDAAKHHPRTRPRGAHAISTALSAAGHLEHHVGARGARWPRPAPSRRPRQHPSTTSAPNRARHRGGAAMVSTTTTRAGARPSGGLHQKQADGPGADHGDGRPDPQMSQIQRVQCDAEWLEHGAVGGCSDSGSG